MPTSFFPRLAKNLEPPHLNHCGRCNGRRLARRLALFHVAIICLATTALQANPTGGAVAAGTAKIAGQGTSAVTVNQSSNLAVINWQTFSINSGESTSFLQPSAGSAALNRVLGGQTSLINGTLTANGQVYLINGNGIIVGPGGVINAGAFTASTRDIKDADFLSGNLHFTGSSSAGVQNLGTINALGGNVVLIGRTVENEGTITAPKGTAGLIAGDDVLLAQENADGSVITVSPSATTPTAGGLVGVKNGGAITAAAAELKAANGNIYALAVQNQGTIRATTISHQGGHIWLTSDSGTVSNSGTLDASATAAGGHGGSVILKSATGMASHTGQIIARGGNGGTGGNAEISGAQVQFSGTADLRAPDGPRGNLLIDPATIDIITGGGSDLNGSTIDPGAIVAQLNLSDVTLNGTSSITVDDTIDASANSNSGNLTLATPVLDLNAGIELNGSFSSGAGTVNVGPNGLVQNAIDGVASGGTVNLTGGATYGLSNEVVINKDVDLEGNGAILDGQNSTRVMEVDSGSVTLDNLTVQGGNGVSASGVAGASWNGDGGALLVYGAGNTANVFINDSTFTGNSASSGGAIFSVIIGGGSHSVVMENSTFTGNSATLGSALYNYGSFGGNASMALKEDTIAANSGSGAIYSTVLSSGSATVMINESILAGNTNFGGESDYVDGGGGTLNDTGFNLYGQNGNAGGFVPGGLGDILLGGGLATVLTPLGDFGGLTPTMALVAGSPALEAGDPAFDNSPDQRGVTRADTTSFTGSAPDIGAFEAQYVSVQADPIGTVYGALPTFTYTITAGPATATLTGTPALISPATDVGFYGEDIGQGTLTASLPYILDFTDGDLTISPRPVTVIPDPGQGKIYGSADPVLTYTTAPADTTSGLVNGDSLNGAISYDGAGSVTNVGNYPTNLGTLSNSNYTILLSATAPTFAIIPALLEYVADAVDVPVGASFPPLTGSVVGFVNGDTLSNATTGTLVFSTPAQPGAPEGVYPIIGSGLTANNYIIGQNQANATALTIGPSRGGTTSTDTGSTSTDTSTSDPNMPVSQAIAQQTPPPVPLPNSNPSDPDNPNPTTPTPVAPASPSDEPTINPISPNEFVDGAPADASPSGASGGGALAQGSSFSQAASGPPMGPSTTVAPGQTVTLSGGTSATAPPPTTVQTQFDQGFTPESRSTLASAAAASAAAASSGNPNGAAPSGPVTVVAPGQTVALAGGASVNVPPPAMVQTQIDQGFSSQSRSTLTTAAAAAGGASNHAGEPAGSGPVTVAAPGRTVTVGGGKAANIPIPAPAQAALGQGLSTQTHDTLSEALGQ